MEDFNMPESSARACIKELMGDNHGLFWYCKDEDYLVLDEEYVDDFFEDIGLLLRKKSIDYQRIKELEEELLEYRNLFLDLKRIMDHFVKGYGEDSSNEK